MLIWHKWFFLPGIALGLCFNATVAAQSSTETLQTLAQRYVEIGLRFQNFDKAHFLYTGPDSWLQAARSDRVTLPQLLEQLQQLNSDIAALIMPSPQLMRRQRDLVARVVAMQTRGNILLGNPPSNFDEETQQLFGVVVPHYSESHFVELASELEALIPGEDDLATRLERFRDQFVIPPDRLREVIGRAMQECRRRTLQWIELPADESVTINITQNQPWVGFTEFHGDAQSTVHINRDVPVHIERAVELGCHEGYPGHHVHATLLEQRLVQQRGWVEYQFIQLIGPLAVVAEGAASYAPEMAFRRSERIAFEREVLLPLAGLSSRELERYYHYIDLIGALNFARNEVARRYLYEEMPRADAIKWLMQYGLETHGTATQRLNFIDALRSYVINYNFGSQIVANYLARWDQPQQRWQAFEQLLATPLSPVDIAPELP